jgi:hypothetical protein
MIPQRPLPMKTGWDPLPGVLRFFDGILSNNGDGADGPILAASLRRREPATFGHLSAFLLINGMLDGPSDAASRPCYIGTYTR